MSELIDNGRDRVEALKEVLRGIQGGEPLPLVRDRMVRLVQSCDASDVACAEQQLIREGVPVAQITSACDLHAQAVRQVLVDRSGPALPAGHPVETFRSENLALLKQCATVRASLDGLAAGPAEEPPAAEALHAAREQHGLLMDVDKHYARKENLLFPFLEKRGITGPSTVMWAKDDEARALLKELGAALRDDTCTAAEWALVRDTLGAKALAAVEEMAFKEDNILLPMSLQKLTEDEWGQVAAQSPQFGWCLVDPAGAWQPASAAAAPGAAVGGAVNFASGSMTPEQLQAVFSTLPVDVTFVDADDRVRFFSEGGGRVFHRAKAVIGRKVQNCHPPASVGTVDRILTDFRSGAQDVAEFWIQMRGRFVHIRYFALRDAERNYLGTLEVTQDLTRLRTLEGDRRLLQYES